MLDSANSYDSPIKGNDIISSDFTYHYEPLSKYLTVQAIKITGIIRPYLKMSHIEKVYQTGSPAPLYFHNAQVNDSVEFQLMGKLCDSDAGGKAIQESYKIIQEVRKKNFKTKPFTIVIYKKSKKSEEIQVHDCVPIGFEIDINNGNIDLIYHLQGLLALGK
jgi:hypothetical protein